MTGNEALMKWITRGVQRHAVTKNLHRPISSVQIWRSAKKDAPRLTMRDTRAILRELQAKGLATCLNPTALTGRIYAATDAGDELLRALFPSGEAESTGAFDPEALSFILRGRMRHAVFHALTTEQPRKVTPTCASSIKRHLRGVYPITLSQAIRALRELEGAGSPFTSVSRRAEAPLRSDGDWRSAQIPRPCGCSSTCEASLVRRARGENQWSSTARGFAFAPRTLRFGYRRNRLLERAVSV